MWKCPKHGVTVTCDDVLRTGKVEILIEPGMPVGQCWLSTNFHRTFAPRHEDLAEAASASGCTVTPA